MPGPSVMKTLRCGSIIIFGGTLMPIASRCPSTSKGPQKSSDFGPRFQVPIKFDQSESGVDCLEVWWSCNQPIAGLHGGPFNEFCRLRILKFLLTFNVAVTGKRRFCEGVTCQIHSEIEWGSASWRTECLNVLSYGLISGNAWGETERFVFQRTDISTGLF